MTTIPFSGNGKTPFQQLIGYNLQIQQRWTNLEDALLLETELSSGLLEEVRRTLAFGNECLYCMAKGKPRNIYSEKRESLATAFADLFVKDVNSISKAHFEILREEFSDAEISQLCAFISFTTASQKLGKIFNLK